MPRVHVLSILPALAGACVLGERAPVVPAVGAWSYEDGGLLETTCPDDLYRDPDATFAIVSSDTSGFVVDDGERFDCTLDGSRFTCPERRQLELPFAGVTVTWRVAVEGRFVGPFTMEGEQAFTLACEGQACALAPTLLGVTFPCAYTVAFTATHGS